MSQIPDPKPIGQAMSAAFISQIWQKIKPSTDAIYQKRTALARARIVSATNQAVTTATSTAITLVDEQFDPAVLQSGSTLVAKTAGVYLIWGQIFWDVNSTGVRVVRVLVNGTEVGGDTRDAVTDASNGTEHQASAVSQLAVGDVVSLQGYQDSGGNLNATSGGSYLAVAMIST